jgi:hypothetical protein
MKAALAARPAADLQARLSSLQQMAVAQANATGLPPASVAQQLIFDGYLLDTRVTAITYCLLCTFIYLLVCNPRPKQKSIGAGITPSSLASEQAIQKQP